MDKFKNRIYKNESYLSYYTQKQEDFSFIDQTNWRTKQKSVFSVLKAVQPKLVLDLGACTGWYSLLAENLGAIVMAVDIDQTVLNHLATYSKQHNLKIFPVQMAFQDLLQENSICSPSSLESDVVLCLALIHHLVLVAGLKLDAIMQTLATMTKQVLILEYIDLEDDVLKKGLIASTFNDKTFHEQFVHNYTTYARMHYNIETLLKLGEQHFSSVRLLDSHPDTRKLLVFSK